MCAVHSASTSATIAGRRRDAARAALGDPHQPRPPVGGVGHAFDVPRAFELIDQEARASAW